MVPQRSDHGPNDDRSNNNSPSNDGHHNHRNKNSGSSSHNHHNIAKPLTPPQSAPSPEFGWLLDKLSPIQQIVEAFVERKK